MAPLSLLELCWDYSAEIEQTSFVLAAWACKSKKKIKNKLSRDQRIYIYMQQ